MYNMQRHMKIQPQTPTNSDARPSIMEFLGPVLNIASLSKRTLLVPNLAESE